MGIATMPETPKDHNAIQQSITSTNAYAILITSGSSQTIFIAFCSTSIVNGNLAKKKLVLNKYITHDFMRIKIVLFLFYHIIKTAIRKLTILRSSRSQLMDRISSSTAGTLRLNWEFEMQRLGVPTSLLKKEKKLSNWGPMLLSNTCGKDYLPAEPSEQ